MCQKGGTLGVIGERSAAVALHMKCVQVCTALCSKRRTHRHAAPPPRRPLTAVPGSYATSRGSALISPQDCICAIYVRAGKKREGLTHRAIRLYPTARHPQVCAFTVWLSALMTFQPTCAMLRWHHVAVPQSTWLFYLSTRAENLPNMR